MTRSGSCPTRWSARSPPARSSSGRPRWSRSCSRTASTPARRRSPSRSSRAASKRVRVTDDGGGIAPRRAPARARAPRHQQDRDARRSRARRDARLPRRGAGEHRLGRARRGHLAHGRCARTPGASPPRAVRLARPNRRRTRSAPRSRSRDLYFNTPARRKFLKSEPTELAHCADAFDRAALARPDVALTLRHGDRVTRHYPAAPPAARVGCSSRRRLPPRRAGSSTRRRRVCA